MVSCECGTAEKAREYMAYGRTFRVERAGRSGLFWAVGHAKGRRPLYLDKMGPRATRQAMQTALDGWAARAGASSK